MSAGTTTTHNLTVQGVATFGGEVHIPDGGTVFAGSTPLLTLSTASGVMLSTGITSGANDNAVVNKAYVDLVATGVRTLKDAVRTASSDNLAGSFAAGVLTGASNGALTQDGVALAVNDRVLLRAQTLGAQNGIYVVTATGSAGAPFVLSRASDANASTEVSAGMFVWVIAGAVLRGSGWVLTTAGAVLNTTSLTFVQVSGIPPMNAGDGIAITAAGTVSVEALSDASLAANTVVVTADGIAVAAALPQLTSAGSASAALSIPGSGTDAYASVVASDASRPLVLGAVPASSGGITAGRAIEFGDRSSGTWRILPRRTGSGAPALLVQVSDGVNWSTVQTFNDT